MKILMMLPQWLKIKLTQTGAIELVVAHVRLRTKLPSDDLCIGSATVLSTFVCWYILQLLTCMLDVSYNIDCKVIISANISRVSVAWLEC